MPLPRLAPAFVRLFYTSNGHSHNQVLHCRLQSPVTPGIEPDIERRDGSTIAASILIAAWGAVMQPWLRTTDTFTGYEIYEYDPVTGDPLFIFGDDLSIAGTASTTNVANSQAIVSLGTSDGRVMKIYVMEGIVAVNQRVPAKVSSPSPTGSTVTYLLSNTNWIVGLGNAWPVRGIFFTSKINDSLRKKYLLDA